MGKSYFWNIVAVPKQGGRSRVLERDLTLTEANANLAQKRKERGRTFKKGAFTFKKVRGRLRPARSSGSLPKYMTKRAKKQMPLNKREFQWLQRHGIIDKSVSWEDWQKGVTPKR